MSKILLSLLFIISVGYADIVVDRIVYSYYKGPETCDALVDFSINNRHHFRCIYGELIYLSTNVVLRKSCECTERSLIIKEE